ncbi:MAG: hypothetical protein L6R41_003990 [Letrouitia leprolyta]|nr:MAG: hypothetical protein L6R41_003990 [Letrouitia leprolyta]
MAWAAAEASGRKVIKNTNPSFPTSVSIRDKYGLLIDRKTRLKIFEDFRQKWLEVWDPIFIKILEDGNKWFGNLLSFKGQRDITAKDVFSSLIKAYNQNGTCTLALWDGKNDILSIGETIDKHWKEAMEEEQSVSESPSHLVETSLLPSKIVNAVSQDGGSAAQIMGMSAPEFAGRAL